MKKKLSIVIVEYHSIEEISRCVSSLKIAGDIPYEIIVSSNSCYTDEEKKKIDFSMPDVHWQFNERNGGFAYAMNEGLKIAVGDYFIIMNSDCIFTSDIECMVQFMDQHKEIGAMGPKMLDIEGNLQDTARPYVTLPRFLWRQVKRVLLRQTSILNPGMDYSKIQTVDWVIGAFIMVSRKAYENTHGLDSSFFMYAEDLDWCTRIRKSGLEVVYYPEMVITYKGTRRARNSKKYAWIFIKTHIAYWRKFGFVFGYPKRKKQIYNTKTR